MLKLTRKTLGTIASACGVNLMFAVIAAYALNVWTYFDSLNSQLGYVFDGDRICTSIYEYISPVHMQNMLTQCIAAIVIVAVISVVIAKITEDENEVN